MMLAHTHFCFKLFGIIGLAVLLIFSTAPPTNALSDEQRKLYQKNILYYDLSACSEAANVSNDEASADSPLGPVYVLGDSITVGAKDDLEKELKDESPYVNGSGSRSITGKGVTAGQKTSGLEAVDADKERVEKAATIVIALGTNQNAEFEKSIKNLVGKIKGHNKTNAKIYWVNVFSKGGSDGYDKLNQDKINSSISKQSSELGYTVIDTTKAKIELSDSVHPTKDGYKTYVKLVTDEIKGTDNSQSATSNSVGGCVCGGIDSGSASLVGSENAEKAFNFFVGKGLKAFQAAGIVGNMIHESGVEPQRQEGIFNRKVPANEFPAPGGGPGWGVVQFTPGSKFINPTKSANKDPNDLGVQLEFVWQQLEGKGPIPENPKILEQIKASSSTREAVLAFQGNTSAGGSYIGYERPADQSGSVDKRTADAKNILTKFGSGSGGSGESDSVTCETEEGSGQVTGEYSLPHDKKWYKSNPEYFTGAHHSDPNDPAVDIPVPLGTPVYSITDGKILRAPNEGGYGRGVTIVAPDGVQYDYGHGTDGGSVKGAKQGDTVRAGQLIMHVNDTGSSRGNHLHLSILVKGKEVCPQKFLVSIAKGSPIDPKTLPSTGCTNL